MVPNETNNAVCGGKRHAGLVSQSRLHIGGSEHNGAILSVRKLSTPFLRSNSNRAALT
jgi:hypothetical protein